MNKTSISYLTHTWNPLAMRCTKVSPACDHCWHLVMANRLAKNPMLSVEARAAYAGETEPVLIESRLSEPLKRKKPSIIGVQFMGDLFLDRVPDIFIQAVWTEMEVAHYRNGHTFLVLTKRPRRMLEFVSDFTACQTFPDDEVSHDVNPGIWLGVTVENQQTADERIPLLLQTPAAVRFVSAEPLLGSLDLTKVSKPGQGRIAANVLERHGHYCGLNWVITGGETGPGARPAHPDWFRGLRDQCQAAEVAFHFKQWGEWLPVGQMDIKSSLIGKKHSFGDGCISMRVGNKRAGHLLDGKSWRQMPEVRK